MNRRTPKPHRDSRVGFFDRFAATVLGGAAGGISYAGGSLWSHSSRLRDVLNLSGPLRWWILGGAVIGAIGGLNVAQSMWESATDDVRSEASFAFWFGVVLIVIVALLIIVFKLGLA